MLVSLLVIIALTATSWTKKMFGRGVEEAISLSQPVVDQLNRLVEGQEDEIKAMVSSENISEVLTMVQHLDLPIHVRRECNQMFVRCTADVRGGQGEAFIWMRHNVGQETCRQILDDVDFSSTCREELVTWTKANAPSRCITQSQRKFLSILISKALIQKN